MRIKLIFSFISAILLIILLQYLEVNILKIPYEQSVVKTILIDPLTSLIKTIFTALGSPFQMLTNFFTKQMPPALGEYAGLMAFLTIMMIIIAGIYLAWRVMS